MHSCVQTVTFALATTCLAAFDNIFESQALNYLTLYAQTVTEWREASMAPPPFNLLSIPYEVWSDWLAPMCKRTSSGGSHGSTKDEGTDDKDETTATAKGKSIDTKVTKRSNAWRPADATIWDGYNYEDCDGMEDWLKRNGGMDKLIESIAAFVVLHENEAAQVLDHRHVGCSDGPSPC